MATWLKWVIFIGAALIAGSLGKEIGKSIGDRASKPVIRSVSGNVPEDALRKGAEQFAPRLPIAIDPVTQLVEVQSSKQRLTYQYVVASDEITWMSPEDFHGSLDTPLTVRACHSSLRQLIDQGVVASYEYRRPDGLSIGRIEVSAAKCRAVELLNGTWRCTISERGKAVRKVDRLYESDGVVRFDRRADGLPSRWFVSDRRLVEIWDIGPAPARLVLHRPGSPFDISRLDSGNLAMRSTPLGEGYGVEIHACIRSSL